MVTESHLVRLSSLIVGSDKRDYWMCPLPVVDMIICVSPLLWSLSGVKRTQVVAPHMSAFGGKADIPSSHRECLVLTQRGH